MSFITVFRTYLWDECVDKMAEKARKFSQGGDFIVAADFSRGSFPTPGFECIGHTEEELSGFGLPIIPNDRPLWHNWDYICPVILSWGKKYDYYVVTESDVSVNFPVSLLCDKMREDDIDLIVDFIHEPTSSWMWYNDALSVSKDPLACLLCVSIFSHKALEIITKKRFEMAEDYAAGIRTRWPFCESVVPATIRDAGLKIADLQDFADLSHFHFETKYSEHNPLIDATGSFVHSVISGKKFIDNVLNSKSTRYFIDKPLNSEALLRNENRSDVRKCIVRKSLLEPDYVAASILSRRYGIDIYSKDNPVTHKPVATSSISDYYSSHHIPTEADNFTNPNWVGEFAFHTNNEHHPWVAIDLLEKICLKTLTITNRKNYSYRFDKFKLETSIDGEIWVDDFFSVVKNDENVDLSIHLTYPSISRFIRVTSLADECLHLCSIQAEAVPLASSQDLSIFAVADISSISSHSKAKDRHSEAQSLFIGASDYSIHTDNEIYPWWQATFDRLVLIEQIRIENRPGWRSRFLRFSFETSHDGKNWKVVRLVLDGESPSVSPLDEILWHPQRPFLTRYFRVRLLEKGILDLRRISIQGRPCLEAQIYTNDYDC